jgi:hypothetical protein
MGVKPFTTKVVVGIIMHCPAQGGSTSSDVTEDKLAQNLNSNCTSAQSITGLEQCSPFGIPLSLIYSFSVVHPLSIVHITPSSPPLSLIHRCLLSSVDPECVVHIHPWVDLRSNPTHPLHTCLLNSIHWGH